MTTADAPVAPGPTTIVPDTTLSGFLATVAARKPAAAALITPDAALTYGELNDRVAACAARLAAILRTIGAPPTGNVIAVASILDPGFAVAYYGVLRSGNVVTPVIPLLPPPGLRHVLATSGARLAVMTPALQERIAAIGEPLPRLDRVVSFDDITGAPSSVPAAAPAAPAGTDAAAGSIASIQFTSGTTGDPKAVCLSHRNLLVNAMQTAAAHGLDDHTVTANHLPTYHPMHLNSALVAGATQLLCPVESGVDAMRLAAAGRASHFYSLPVRLARLAAQPDLDQLRVPSLRVIASGGSPLAPALAATLAAQLDVPVIQGYGLAETSPLTHSDRWDRPHPGSVGPPVADTECRIVDVDSRRPVEVGGVGEVQVRGPQLMLGYLEPDGSVRPGVDADGWFSTGDIGRLDDDGWLFLVDRLKDVFKYDNWLVSPTTIEAALLRRPEVRDCCVIDRPDELHGGTAHAFVVTAPGTTDGALARAIDDVNDELAPFEQVRSFEPVALIPRSPQGKVPRARLRDRLARGRTAITPRPALTPEGEAPMITIVNRFTVTGDAAEFERVHRETTAYLRTQPGLHSARLVRSFMDADVYIDISEWESPEAHQAAFHTPRFQEQIVRLGKVASVETHAGSIVDESADTTAAS